MMAYWTRSSHSVAFLSRIEILVVNIFCVFVMAIMTTSCGFNTDPPRSVVMEALQVQISDTQSSISESLGLDPTITVPDVSRVRVGHQETLKLDGQRFTHLEGSFDWQLPQDPVRVDSAFELFLLRGERGEGWTLARPVSGTADDIQSWLLYPLGLPAS